MYLTAGQNPRLEDRVCRNVQRMTRQRLEKIASVCPGGIDILSGTIRATIFSPGDAGKEDHPIVINSTNHGEPPQTNNPAFVGWRGGIVCPNIRLCPAHIFAYAGQVLYEPGAHLICMSIGGKNSALVSIHAVGHGMSRYCYTCLIV